MEQIRGGVWRLRRLRAFSRSSDARGFSIIEASMALGIMGVVIALALPMINAKPLNMRADRQDFALQMQVTREFAISRTLHYRLLVLSGNPPTQYEILQGQCSSCGGNWTFTTVVRTITLRTNVVFAQANGNQYIEFDERGQVVTPGAPFTFTLTDTARGWSKQVTVNSAGMVDTP